MSPKRLADRLCPKKKSEQEKFLCETFRQLILANCSDVVSVLHLKRLFFDGINIRNELWAKTSTSFDKVAEHYSKGQPIERLDPQAKPTPQLIEAQNTLRAYCKRCGINLNAKLRT